jgi:hypothetical protein
MRTISKKSLDLNRKYRKPKKKNLIRTRKTSMHNKIVQIRNTTVKPSVEGGQG